MIRKSLIATAAAAAVLATAAPAQAANINMTVTRYSQSAIWTAFAGGSQDSVAPGQTGYNAVSIYTGPGWCTAIRYPDDTIVYGVGGSSGSWKGLATTHGNPRVESWKGCWS